MFPQANYSLDRPYIQCPPGQAAVGYSAQSGMYSLTNVTVSFSHRKNCGCEFSVVEED